MNCVREIPDSERILASALAKTMIRRRKELGKTQEQVALAADMDRNHYQLMEHARSDRKTNYPANPRLNTLIKIARVLECSVEELLREPLAAYQQAESTAQSAVRPTRTSELEAPKQPRRPLPPH